MSVDVVTIVILLSSVFVSSQVVGEKTDPLIFQYDRLNGQKVYLISNSTSDVQKIEFRLVTTDKYGTKVYNDWKDLYHYVGNPFLPLQWTKPDGICSEYELRTTLFSNNTFVQYLNQPSMGLSANSKIRATGIGYDPNSDTVQVGVFYGTDMDYWTGSTTRYLSIDPYLKYNGCQSLYTRYPPPPQALSGGHLLVFPVQYAQSNCSFVYGLNITMDSPNERCVKSFFTNETESLTLNLSCSTVVNLICTKSNLQCPSDCSPLEVKSVTSVLDYRNRTGIYKNNDYLTVTWLFSEDVRRSAYFYRVRYAEANISDWNTVFNEKNQTVVDVRNKFLDIHPNESSNFTFQICAILSESCQQNVEWDREKKFKIEYKREKSRDDPAPSKYSPGKGAESMTVDVNIFVFISLHIVSLLIRNFQ